MAITLTWQKPKEYVAYGIKISGGRVTYVIIGRFYDEMKAEHAVRKHARQYSNKYVWLKPYRTAKTKNYLLTLGKVVVQ